METTTAPTDIGVFLGVYVNTIMNECYCGNYYIKGKYLVN